MTPYSPPGILADWIDIITNHYGITRDQLFSRCRKREICEARQVIMCLDQTIEGKSQATAGFRFRLDHATAYHAKVTIKNMIETDKQFKAKFTNLLFKLAIPTEKINFILK